MSGTCKGHSGLPQRMLLSVDIASLAGHYRKEELVLVPSLLYSPKLQYRQILSHCGQAQLRCSRKLHLSGLPVGRFER